MQKVELHGVVKRFGQNTVCDGVNLTVQQGQMVCLIGASGAGKSTLLRCINLLEAIEEHCRWQIFFSCRRERRLSLHVRSLVDSQS